MDDRRALDARTVPAAVRCRALTRREVCRHREDSARCGALPCTHAPSGVQTPYCSAVRCRAEPEECSLLRNRADCETVAAVPARTDGVCTRSRGNALSTISRLARYVCFAMVAFSSGRLPPSIRDPTCLPPVNVSASVGNPVRANATKGCGWLRRVH